MPLLESKSFSSGNGGGVVQWTPQGPPWTPPPPTPPPTPPAPLMPPASLMPYRLIGSRVRAWGDTDYQMTLDDMVTAAALNLIGGEGAYALLLAKMAEQQALDEGDVPTYLDSLNVEIQVTARLGLHNEYRQTLARLNSAITPEPGEEEGDIALPTINPGPIGGGPLPRPQVPPTPPPPFLEDQEAFLSLIELVEHKPIPIIRDMLPTTVGGAEWLLRGGEPAAAVALAADLAEHTDDDLARLRLRMTELLAYDRLNDVVAAEAALVQLRQQVSAMLQ